MQYLEMRCKASSVLSHGPRAVIDSFNQTLSFSSFKIVLSQGFPVLSDCAASAESRPNRRHERQGAEGAGGGAQRQHPGVRGKKRLAEESAGAGRSSSPPASATQTNVARKSGGKRFVRAGNAYEVAGRQGAVQVPAK